MSNEIPEELWPLPSCVVAHTADGITLTDSRGRSCKLGHKNKGRELYRLGNWYLEAIRDESGNPGGPSCQIFAECLSEDANSLTMEFESPPVDLSVLFQESGLPERMFRGVSTALLYPGKGIKIMKWERKEQGSSTNRTPNAPTAKPSDSPLSPFPAAVSQNRGVDLPQNRGDADIPAAVSQNRDVDLRQNRSGADIPAAVSQYRDVDLPQNRGDVADLRRQIEWMQTMMTNLTAQPMNNLLSELKSNRQFLPDQLRKKVDEAEHLERERESAEKSVRAAEARIRTAMDDLERLKAEQVRLGEREEMYKMDCGKVRRELDGARKRLEADEDALKLMGDISELPEPTFMKKTLEEAGKKMDDMEAWLGRIIRIQEFLQNRVRRSILEGDGRLSTAEESGGEENGVGERGVEPAQTANEEPGKSAKRAGEGTGGGPASAGSRV